MGITVDENQAGMDIDLSQSDNNNLSNSIVNQKKAEEDFGQITDKKRDSKTMKNSSDYIKNALPPRNSLARAQKLDKTAKEIK